MKQSILYLALCFLIISCGKETKKEQTEEKSKSETTSIKSSEFGKTNYAIVWNWATKDTQLVSDNSVQISSELTDLWKKDVVENIYYNSEGTSDKLANFPNISFLLNAQSEQEAKTILNKLTVVEKGIAKYTVHKVGTKWLGRNKEAIDKNGLKKSWAAVWSTRVDHNSESSKEEVRQNAKEQSDAVISLWNKGLVENVYFDITGIEKRNDITDFVLYVNADTEREAQEILNNLPFSKKNIAHYQLFPVGIFWMGNATEN
ncbi:hypothetical protein [Aureibaculum conchae]|uniref:hypothetical protein n=1 Tax=Aureibaculum sp. 2308TA14-22 TaxID=3108392 RepID=UPI003399F295